jgi:hypothetical protein
MYLVQRLMDGHRDESMLAIYGGTLSREMPNKNFVDSGQFGQFVVHELQSLNEDGIYTKVKYLGIFSVTPSGVRKVKNLKRPVIVPYIQLEEPDDPSEV